MKRRMSRREFLRVGAGLAAGTVAVACAAPAPAPTPEPQVVEKIVEKVVTATPPPPEPVTIVATNHLNLEAWTGTAARIKEALPNVSLELVHTPWGGGWGAYADSVITRIAGGEQIDILAIGIELVPLMAGSNILQPLNHYLAADDDARKDYENDIHPLLMGMPNLEGKQYGIPYAWNNMVIHYNTKVFEEAGVEPPKPDWTWDDFLQICRKLAEVKGTEDDRFAYHCDDVMFMLQPWFHSNDTSPLTHDWKDSNMLDPNVAESLQFLQDLILTERVMISPQAGVQQWNLFLAGHVAMHSAGRWWVPFYMGQEFEDWNIQLFPRNKVPIQTVVGTHQHGITTLTQNPDAAWEVLKLMTSAEQIIEQMEFIGDIPSRRSGAASERFQREGPANVDLWYGSLDYGKPVPQPVNFNIVDPLLRRHYASVWNGESTVEAVVQAAHEELRAEMDLLKT